MSERRERAIMAVGSVVQDYDRLVCGREREKRESYHGCRECRTGL